MARRSAITVRPAAPGEIHAVLDLERDAFGGEEEAAIAAALAADPAVFVPELSLVAVDGDRIVGHVLLTRAHVGGVPAVLLAPLAVAPDRQHQGIGGMLVHEGLTRARELGAALALVLGHPGYYPRFGFVAALPRGIEAPHPVDVPEAWMAAELEPGALWAAKGVAHVAAVFDDPAMWRE